MASIPPLSNFFIGEAVVTLTEEMELDSIDVSEETEEVRQLLKEADERNKEEAKMILCMQEEERKQQEEDKKREEKKQERTKALAKIAKESKEKNKEARGLITAKLKGKADIKTVQSISKV